jgi:hypothetical protein
VNKPSNASISPQLISDVKAIRQNNCAKKNLFFQQTQRLSIELHEMLSKGLPESISGINFNNCEVIAYEQKTLEIRLVGQFVLISTDPGSSYRSQCLRQR